MNINISKQNDFNVIEIHGRLDINNSNKLEQTLLDLSRTDSKFVLDCTGLDYISSSGLRVFLMFLKKVSSGNGVFHICCLQDVIKEVFDISGFTSLFKIFTTRNEALNK